MREIVLWGASGHARVLAEFLGALDFAVVALVDNDPALTSFLPGVPLLRGEVELGAWRRAHPGELYALVAIGGARGAERLAIQDQLSAAGYTIPTAVHPRAFVAAGATLGAGTHVLALAAVAAAARLGAGCIVNTSASVDHECRLADGVHIGPGATLAGNVTVGRNAFIGTGAAIVPHVTIGAGAIVGAGSVVVHDVPPDTIAYGNPARVARAVAK
jgi:sugar O-acyltransferase (sialic acid O-acetyltransferase NeuD family)